jgi:hypothetical protein
MKRTAVILALLLVAIAASLSLWRELDAPTNAPEPIARSVIDGPVQADGGPPQKTALESDAAEHAAESKLTLARAERAPISSSAEPDGITVHGTLRDSVNRRRFIAGASIKLSSPSKKLEFKSDLDGQFELHDFRPGRWSIAIEADGYRPWARDWTFPADPAFQEFLVGLDRLNVVWVAMRTPEGGDFFEAAKDVFDILKKDPLAQSSVGIVLVATSTAPGELLVPGQDGLRRTPEGDVSLDVGPSGGTLVKGDRYFEFPKPLPMFLSACCGDVVLDTQFVQDGQGTVTLSISDDPLRRQLHIVKLRVLEADGEAPVPGALVSIAPDLIVARGGRAVDAAGRVQFENQLPGARSLSIQAPEHEWLQLSVRVATVGDTDLGAIRLARSTMIQGQCVFEGAAPMDVALSVFQLDREPRVSATSAMQFHGETPGSFTFKELGRHRYSIRVIHPHWSAKPVVVDTTNGSVTGVKIDCVPAASVVLNVDPERVDEIFVTDSDQLPVTEVAVPIEGRVSFNLFPGSFTASLRKAGQTIATTRFQAGGGDQVIDLRHS